VQTRHTDGRITIRPYQFSDIDELLAASRESTREVYPWLEWCKPSYSVQDTEAWIRYQQEMWAARSEYNFIIIDTDTRAILGGIGLNHIQPIDRLANLGYWVRTGQTGKGIATAAVRLVAGFAFKETTLLRLEIVVNVANHASQRVAEKAGAHKEGILRNRIFMHGASHDAVLYSLIAEDLGR
jgi:RimJ/RimL family protein N-acetyltransferase